MDLRIGTQFTPTGNFSSGGSEYVAGLEYTIRTPQLLEAAKQWFAAGKIVIGTNGARIRGG